MSCRVLKRGMEHFTLNTLVEYAGENGFKRIVGEYIATPKNKMVEEHYQNLGFTPLTDATCNLYVLEIDTYEMKECYIKII
jgi:predicted enzyme involved in methoxymalonyl-ACP biosynthesis